MCGKFVCLTWDEVLGVIRAIQMDSPFDPEPDWPARRTLAFPRSNVAIIIAENGQLLPKELRWGFTAPWDERKVLFNTRIETALDGNGGIWHDAIQHGRCIVPTFGFFETYSAAPIADAQSARQAKRQYEFSLTDSPCGLTLLAGVCDEDAFSVVTTKPNATVAPIHERMPIVLRENEASRWIHGDLAALADRSDVELHAEAVASPKEPSLFDLLDSEE